MVRQKFSELSTLNQERARANFFNAGPEDGYLYELNTHKEVLCRCTPTDAQKQDEDMPQMGGWTDGRHGFEA